MTNLIIKPDIMTEISDESDNEDDTCTGNLI